MRKLLSFLLVLAILYLGLEYKDEIREYVLINFVNENLIVREADNIYAKDSSLYEETDDYYPENREDIVNIFYTALNGGWDKVVFFCTSSYPTCIDDVVSLSGSSDFNKVNNYVHPYNSYKKILLEYNSMGKVQISIIKLYSEADIVALETKANEIIANNVNNNMSLTDKIKVLHDYIINNTVYDEEAADEIESGLVAESNAYKANGALIEGSAICGGYTDAMAILLSKLGIDNYKISSTKHVWNYVYVNNTWLHLDLTWDDPVTNTGENLLLHTFFLVTDDELKKLDTTEHSY
ncbi:MAG: transglutaminase domain-containing protein [Bacilli bacterium]|nr:transglutaminase domain-containing protein [Bacilli bacterium]